MNNMSILAVVLLVLFTLEIIFIFTYMPTSTQDYEPSPEPKVGPPQLPPPAPPIYINEDDYEFDGNFGRDHRGRHPGRHHPGRHHPGKHDDDDKKHVLRRIHFFIVKKKYEEKREDDGITIKPDFNYKNPDTKYKVTLDKKIKDEMLLIANYHDARTRVKYTLEGDDKEILEGEEKGGTIELGTIGDLKKYKKLEFTIKEKNK